MDNDIEAEGAVVRREGSQLCRAVDLVVTATFQACLQSREGTDVQSDNSLRLSFEHLQLGAAKRADFRLGIEVNRRLVRKEAPGVHTGDQPLNSCIEKSQRFERGFFLRL